MTASSVTHRRNSMPIRIVRGTIGHIRGFLGGITAVSARELRGRMRGRRAFVVVTVYLLLLSAFAFGIFVFLKQRADLDLALRGNSMDLSTPFPGSVTPGYALSASIGHTIFSGLLVLETLLVLVLAPAFTSGAISMEREKQTLDLLVTTPLSTLGMVVGKLLSALTWVLLLIVASIPLMAVVFVFGGVGPEDVARAYLLLFSLAFGMGAIGMFISALVKRTQTATVLAYIVVLALTMGTVAVHTFWGTVATGTSRSSTGLVSIRNTNQGPEALLWLNPLVGDLDLMCTTAPGGYQRYSCDYVAAVTRTPFFGGRNIGCEALLPGDFRREVDCVEMGGQVVMARIADGGVVAVDPPPMAMDGIAVARAGAIVEAAADGLVAIGVADPIAPPANDQFQQQDQASQFGFPRDTFWPRNAAAFLVLGVILTVLSAQLVSPTRRFRIRGRIGRHGNPPTPTSRETTPLPVTLDEVTP